mgnify:CR=1 FL=1
MHRTLEQVLRTLVNDLQYPWLDLPPIAEFYMNSAVSSTTNVWPHEIVFGRPSLDPYAAILASQVPADAPGLQEFAQ